MSTLNPDKLHTTFKGDASPSGPIVPRVYTLTHSDRTGDLFLTIGSDVDHDALREWQTRLMRDEVLAHWHEDETGGHSLHLTCHVSGGLLPSFGPAGWRLRIFKHHMPMVLQAFRYGDAELFAAHPALDDAPIKVRFKARQPWYRRTEPWGTPADYQIA